MVAGSLTGSRELDELAIHDDVRFVPVDLTTPDGPARLVEAATEDGGGLDVLVNNVGAVRPRLQGFLEVTDDDWDWTFTINFLAAVRTMRAAIPHLTGRPGANIVTISSVNAFLPDPGSDRLQRSQGSPQQPVQVAVEGARPRHPRQHRQSRPGRAPTSGWVTRGSRPPSLEAT